MSLQLTLGSFSVQASPLVTDALLTTIAPHIPHLEHLHLAGCPKVTHDGVSALLRANNEGGVLSLGLEGLSSSFVR